MSTTDARTQLHYHYAELAGQMLVTLTIGILIGAAIWWAPATVQATHAVAPTTPQSWAAEGYDGSDSSLAAWDCAHGRTPHGYGIDGTAQATCTPQLVQVASTDVPEAVWQDMLNHGATSDPADACECLYAQPGGLYGPAGAQWTITPDGAEPAGAN